MDANCNYKQMVYNSGNIFPGNQIELDPFKKYSLPKPQKVKKKINPETDAKLISEQKKVLLLFDIFFKKTIDEIFEDLKNEGNEVTDVRGNDELVSFSLKVTPPSNLVDELVILLNKVKDHISIVFIFYLKNDKDKDSSFIEIQKEIENFILISLQGSHYRNEFSMLHKVTRLPSLYIYDTQKFQEYLSINENLDNPLYDFQQNKKQCYELFVFHEMFYPNILQKVGNTLLSIDNNLDEPITSMGGVLLVYLTNRVFKNKFCSLPANYIAFCFDEFNVSNSAILNFVLNFSDYYHLLSVLVHGLKNIFLEDLPKLDTISKSDILIHKRRLLERRIKLYDTFKIVNITYWDEFNANYPILVDESEDHLKPLSELFKNQISNEFNKFNHSYGISKSTVDDYISFIQNEEKIDRPRHGHLFIDIQSEYEERVKKWQGILYEFQIKQWLLNFESTEHKLLALRLLDNLIYINNEDLKNLS